MFNTLLSCLTRTALPFAPLAVAGDSFAFGTTLMLDAAPMRGSKRVPMLEIAEDGVVRSIFGAPVCALKRSSPTTRSVSLPVNCRRGICRPLRVRGTTEKGRKDAMFLCAEKWGMAVAEPEGTTAD